MPESFAFPDFDLNQTDRDIATMEEIYGKNQKKENIFLDTFKEKMQENLKEGFLGQSQRDTRNRDIYGDRRRSSGDTVADLGGGNTAVTPDSASLVQAQMAMANQQQQPGLGGQLAGAGAAAGVSMIPGVGPFLAPVAGNLVSGLFG